MPVPHQSILVDLAIRSEHWLDHELVFVLLRGVILEGLETDGDGDLIPRIHNSGIGFDTVPREKQF